MPISSLPRSLSLAALAAFGAVQKRMKHTVHDVVHISYETNILARVPNSMKVIVARHDEHDQLKACHAGRFLAGVRSSRTPAAGVV